MIPLMLDVSNYRILVIGSGAVGTRKAEYFKDHAKEVKIIDSITDSAKDSLISGVNCALNSDMNCVNCGVDTVINSDVNCVNGDINSVRENIHEIIANYDIVIAATASKELNETICSCALEQKKFYNSATGIGNFLIPATFREDGLTVCVSTEGKAPAVSAFIRDKIYESYPRISEMILLQELLRTELKRAIPSQQHRAEILRNVLEDKSVWERLEDEEFRRSILAHDLNKIQEIVAIHVANTDANNPDTLEGDM